MMFKARSLTIFAIAFGALVALMTASMPASARPLVTASEAATLDHILASSSPIRGALGSTLDVVRVEPVTRVPGEFVIDVATPDHQKGLRVVADLGYRSIVSVTSLARPEIPYTPSDV